MECPGGLSVQGEPFSFHPCPTSHDTTPPRKQENTLPCRKIFEHFPFCFYLFLTFPLSPYKNCKLSWDLTGFVKNMPHSLTPLKMIQLKSLFTLVTDFQSRNHPFESPQEPSILNRCGKQCNTSIILPCRIQRKFRSPFQIT